MIAEKVVIKSNNLSYGPMPAFNDEVEQHVKICRDGQVKITRFVYGSGVKRHGYVKAAKNIFMIPAERAAWLLDLISGYFRDHNEDWFATDIGDFKITITMGDGTKIRRKGSLNQDFEIGDDDLNSIIRETLGDDSLFLFNGHSGQRYIYLSVKFPGSDQEYYYRTTDKSIVVGDAILVPAGKSNRKELVEVTRKEKFYEDELPMPLEEVKSVIGKVILTQDQSSEPLIPEEAQKLNTSDANRGTHEVYFATAEGIKFALDAVGEKKLANNVKDMPAIAKAEEYMRKFLMDKAGNDLDTFLNDFWLYLDESSKSMEEENSAIEKLLYSLTGDCDEFLYGYGKNKDSNSVLYLKQKFWRVYQDAFMRGIKMR
ncbi:MAG: hypothetical protein ACI4W2_01130 [Eubacterium sp.]